MTTLDIRRKLAVLADAAKYDASCVSSGGAKRDSRTGKGVGPAGALEYGATGFVTVHPSDLLRLPDEGDRPGAWRAFVRT